MAKYVHFVGIGGIGMSGIAEILCDEGYFVSGSDIADSAVTDKLKAKGCQIYIGHQEENLGLAEILVISSAIDLKNPEILAAQKKGLPILKRAEMLAQLMQLKKGIAISGSHGKTTTTSMVATIFHHAKLDPTHIIGGVVQNLGSHAQRGMGEFLIAEADESDGSFLFLSPQIIANTNIDNDHLDHYGTEEKLREAFHAFYQKIPFFGKVILNADDPSTMMAAKNLNRPIWWYSALDRGADFFGTEIKSIEQGMTFSVVADGAIYPFELAVSGRHNVLNALAAIAVARSLDLPWKQIQEGLKKFTGVGRRLEVIYKKNNTQVIDDYAHHPTELQAVFEAINTRFKTENKTLIFQPHRYTRTKILWDNFIDVLSKEKEIFLLPIYAASEKPIEGISSEKLRESLLLKGISVILLKNEDEFHELIKSKINNPGIILALGAGNISKMIRKSVEALS